MALRALRAPWRYKHDSEGVEQRAFQIRFHRRYGNQMLALELREGLLEMPGIRQGFAQQAEDLLDCVRERGRVPRRLACANQKSHMTHNAVAVTSNVGARATGNFLPSRTLSSLAVADLEGVGTVEHRWGQRKAAYQRARVVTAGGISAQGFMTNISVSGAFIRTPLPARVLSVVQIAFVTDNRRLRDFGPIAAQVVRKTRDGLGLEWCEQVSEILDVLAIAPASSDALPTRSPVVA
jgi:hypothetical protein